MALRAWSPPRDPTVYSTLEVDVSVALAYLERLRRESGVKVTPTHLVAKGIATALRRHPHANAIIRRGWVHLRDSADVFLQVVADGGEDLGGTKIERADERPLVDIARDLTAKAERIRAHRDPELEHTKRTLDRLPIWMLGPVLRATDFATHTLGLDLSAFGVKPDPFGGAMVSNIGTFGIDWALAPIVPFSRCPIVLIVGTVKERPWVVDGAVVARPVLVIGCTFDHRLLDGALASSVARVLMEVVRDPESYDLAAPADPGHLAPG